MEPFSVAAAAATLCPLIIQTARQLQKVAKSIKYARRELKDLTNEMDIFTNIYDQFMQATEKRMGRTKSGSSARKRLIAWAERTTSDFEKLSKRVDALSRDPLYKHSVAETVSAHWKWYLNKGHLKYLRYTLVVARQSMLSFTHMIHIEKLDELLTRLRSGTFDEKTKIAKEHNMALEECVRYIENKIKDLRERTALTSDIAQEAIEKVTSKQSQSQKEDYFEHTEQLLRFSRAVDREIERNLHPSSRASQKSSHSSSSSRKSKRARRVDSASQVPEIYYVRQQSFFPANKPHQFPHQYTEPESRRPKAAQPRSEAERILRKKEAERIMREKEAERARQSKARQTNEIQQTRTDPDPIPPLSVPNRGNDTNHSKLHPNTDTHVPTEPPKDPPTDLSESTNGAVVDEYVGGAGPETEEEEEEEEIMSDQATYTGSSKWRATAGFPGTEPRTLREKRRRGSASRDHG